MILTNEDLNAISVTLEPRFSKLEEQVAKVEEQISNLTHLSNKRFTAIELRLDAIEYKLQQIAVFIPYENAFLIQPIKKRATD